MRITKRNCDEILKAGAGGSGRTTHWDDQLPGFGVRQGATGHLSFILRYRVKGQPNQRVLTLGDYPTLSPDRARARAAQIKADARLRIDTVAEQEAETAKVIEQRKEAQRREVPVTDLLDLWRAATERAMEGRILRQESVDYERMLLRLEGKVLRPAVKGETVGSLNPQRFQALIHLQGSHSVANNVRALVVRFTRFANAEMISRGASADWPTRFDVPGQARARSSLFTLEQAARIWIGAGKLGRRGALVRFMLLTGCRRVEARMVEWRHDPRAETMLLAIAGQESGWKHRRQMGNGPARGLWQFERGGGVQGVLSHPATRSAALAVCAELLVPSTTADVYAALDQNDALACAFARLLLWSDPKPLPSSAEDGWAYYKRTWRPGKPHPATWQGHWDAAVAARAVPMVG